MLLNFRECGFLWNIVESVLRLLLLQGIRPSVFMEHLLCALDFHRRKEGTENPGPECVYIRYIFLQWFKCSIPRLRGRSWWEVREGARKWSRVALGQVH